jgi:CHASE2 domain-containing sensor protein
LKGSQTSGAVSRRLIFSCGLVPAIIAAALAVYRPAFVARADNAVYDSVLRWAPAKPPVGRVVIVDVDERSLTGIGQWPWRRDLIGRLVARLREMGAATVALDMIFAEPDRYEHETQTTPDAAFAESLRPGRVFLGYAMTFDAAARARSACVLHPLGLAIIEPREGAGDAPFFRGTGAVCSLPILAQAAGASGFLNAAPDSDGILRRAPLLLELDGHVYPGLALSAVAAATGAGHVALRISNVNAVSLILDDRIVPLDGKSNLLLRYRGKKRTFPYISAADVLAGQVPIGTVRDKLVFVGTTALGTREVVATPLDTLFAGVEVHATIADNLLAGDFIRRPELGTTLEGLTALALGIAVTLLVGRMGLLWGAVGGAAGLATAWCGAVWMLSTSGVFVSPLYSTLGVMPALVVMTLAKFAIERRRADAAGHDTSTAQRLMVQTLLSLTEVRDAETGRHSRRTQRYVRLLAEQLSANPGFRDYLTPQRIDLLSSLAPLHDIGKVGVPDRVLNKPGALTVDELAEMRQHPAHGRDVILKAEQRAGVTDDVILAMAKDIVYTHHERWDGAGYPQGLRGAEIPVVGRLMAVVDVYDAAVTRCVYRQPTPHDKVVDLIVAGAGSHFDPAVVEAFSRVAPLFKSVSDDAMADASRPLALLDDHLT